MGDQTWNTKFLNTTKEREQLARIVWLLLDAGTNALKIVFDSIHPPLNLREHLAQSHVKAVLGRLRENEIITEKQWKLLYPTKKKHVLSQKYDSRTLITLLQTICHLCPPYPNGWSVLPLSHDNSIAADVVRMQQVHQELTAMETISFDDYSRTWRLIKETLLRLGGPPMRVKLHRIEHEQITLEMQNHHILQFREIWADGRRIISSPLSTSSKRKGRTTKRRETEAKGLSPEDKATMRKTHKLILDNVVAEDILDRLQQNQIIKFSDRQEILSASKNSDRMQKLLDKIFNSSNPGAFKGFIDAIKFKFKKVHETVVQVRKETYKNGVTNTVDVMGVVGDALCSCYRTNYGKCNPFPWVENSQANIRDIFTTLDIVDYDGKRLHLYDFFPQPCTNGKGKRIFLEGISGSGKSVLCQMVGYLWGTQKTYFTHRFPIFLHVDLQIVEEDLYDHIYNTLLPSGFSMDLNAFRGFLEENSQYVVLLVDGFDGGRMISDLRHILLGNSLKQATVILTVNPELPGPAEITPDSKMYCMGFSQQSINKCFRNYLIHFKANPEHEHYQTLFETIADDTWPLRESLNLPAVCLMTFAHYQTNKQANLRDLSTLTSLFENYGLSMAMHYCKHQKIDVIGYEFPDNIVEAISMLGVFAFNSLIDGKKCFSLDEIEMEVKGDIVHKLGAFSQFTPRHKVRFLTDLMQDFLAAKYLADFLLEDIVKLMKEHSMTKKPKFTQMLTLLCGLYRNDYDTLVLGSILNELAVRNIRQTKVSARDVETPASEGRIRQPSGHIMDFSTSLQSLIETKCREDASEIVAKSLPPKVLLKRDGLYPAKTLKGFSKILCFEDNRITHLEFQLHAALGYQQAQLLDVATAVAQCAKLKSLRVYWSSLEIMAKFMETIMTRIESIESVTLEDACKRPLRNVVASTWATLQEACQNMHKAGRFSFVNSREAAITYFVLQHLPNSVKNLNFTNSSMNMMCAGELSLKLEKTTSIEKLDLTNARLVGSEFVSILQGLKLCCSIKHLKLCGAKLERQGVDALAEFLKLTRTLQVLDISDCHLTTEMCQRLAEAIVENRSLRRLVMRHTKVTSEGRQAISHSHFEQIKVVGLESSNDSTTLPALIAK